MRCVLTPGDNGGTIPDNSMSASYDGSLYSSLRIYILAAGWIESTRLLLLSKSEMAMAWETGTISSVSSSSLHLEYSGGSVVITEPICGFDVPNWRKRRTIQSAWRHSALCRLHKPYRRNQAPTQVAEYALALAIPQDPRGRCADAAHPHRTDAAQVFWHDLGSVTRKFPGVATYIARRMVYGRNKPPAPMASTFI